MAPKQTQRTETRRGPRGKYDPERTPIEIAALARAGINEERIAELVGVSARTLTRWKKSYPELCRAIKSERITPVADVEHSLYSEASGRDYITGKRVRRSNITAAIFYLKCNYPEKYGDKHEHEFKRNTVIKVEQVKGLDYEGEQ